MRTAFTELLGIKYPIVQGAMQWWSRAELAAAVSNAGGLGVITARTFSEPAGLSREIEKLQSLTDKPFAVNVSMLPELAGEDDALGYFEVCREMKVPVVETAGRSPKAFIPMLKEAGILLMHKVPGVRYGVSAAKAGADVITVVGHECGGHPGREAVTTLVMAPLAARRIDAPVLAGGGIADGRGLAAALALGADGVVMGSRFLLAEETPIHPLVRQRLLATDENGTTIVMAGIGNPTRVIANQVSGQMNQLEARGAEFSEMAHLAAGTRGRDAVMAGDPDGGLLALGQCVGSLGEVLPAGEIIRRTVSEARRAMEGLRSALEED